MAIISSNITKKRNNDGQIYTFCSSLAQTVKMDCQSRKLVREKNELLESVLYSDYWGRNFTCKRTSLVMEKLCIEKKATY
jgi:hypothetical protein